jgi:hypothetical protein
MMLWGTAMNLTVKQVLPFAISALAIALLGASNVPNAPNVPNLPIPTNGAMIYNPGTGDYSGFRIVVAPDGRAIAIDGAGHTATQLQSDVVAKFFSDLAAAGQLGQLSARPCSADVNAPTTVEVNSSITITWKGQHSPALTCATDGPSQNLLLDATQIEHALYVQAYRSRNLVTYGLNSRQLAQYGSASRYGLSYRQAARYAFTSGGGGGGAYAAFSPDQFYLPRWQNQDLQFSMDQFYFENFNDGIGAASNPFGASPYTGAPTTTLERAYPTAAAPYASINYTSPWSPPWTSTPFGSSPFTSLGTASPYSGSASFNSSLP